MYQLLREQLALELTRLELARFHEADPDRAMTAPGGNPADWHGSWPTPETPEVEAGHTDGRHLVYGSGG